MVAMARSLLKTENMLKRFWGEAVVMNIYLLNQAPTRSVHNKTPYKAWHGKRPNVHHLCMFGCLTYVKNVKLNAKKLDDHNTHMVFIGYETSSKVYMMYELAGRKLHVPQDVVFDEGKQWDWSSAPDEVPPVPGDIFIMEFEFNRVSGDKEVVVPNRGTEQQPTIPLDAGVQQDPLASIPGFDPHARLSPPVSLR